MTPQPPARTKHWIRIAIFTTLVTLTAIASKGCNQTQPQLTTIK